MASDVLYESSAVRNENDDEETETTSFEYTDDPRAAERGARAGGGRLDPSDDHGELPAAAAVGAQVAPAIARASQHGRGASQRLSGARIGARVPEQHDATFCTRAVRARDRARFCRCLAGDG